MKTTTPQTKQRVRGGVGESDAHESATLHVTGDAVYIDDIPEQNGLLNAYIFYTDFVHARITHFDTTPVENHPGVSAVVSASNVPGINNIGPIFPDEPLFAEKTIEYFGQPVFAVAASTAKIAREAAKLAFIRCEELPPELSIDRACAKKQFTSPVKTLKTDGDIDRALADSTHRLKKTYALGGQDHFYLEGQVSMSVPGENETILVYSSTQHPSEVQHMVAKVLRISHHAVTVETRRLGGGFGGKETQAAGFACISALLAVKTGRAVKLRPDRDDDMIMTGKRHDFNATVAVGFEADGTVNALKTDLRANAGWSADLSSAVCSRAMFHTDSSYFFKTLCVTGHCCKTNTVSNTAFRGFGGPQGIFFTEQIIDDVARSLDKDPLDIRKINYYGDAPRNTTHYGQTVTDFVLHDITEKLEHTSDYRNRRNRIRAFNAKGGVFRRGMALTPVKFGIAFTVRHYNQAGALIHVYPDGTVQLNHGGIEMGQGLFVKIRHIVAGAFQIDDSNIRCMPASTEKIPNTSATAASSGADLNGMAALNAAQTLKSRIAGVLADEWGVPVTSIHFKNGTVFDGNQSVTFPEAAVLCIKNRVSLSATGYYKTPEIHYDEKTGKGNPFYYFAYGAAVSEVVVDSLTGEYKLVRADILHDCGKSLNEAIDRGQIEGGYIQGVGWLTTEELVWSPAGKLLTHAPSTYKIPTCRDIPDEFNVDLYQKPNSKETVHKSKAVGEPPLIPGMSAFFALKDAVASFAVAGTNVLLDAPATPERILGEIERLKELSD